MERFAVIMAGGAGLRLWPLSRTKSPKQFIALGQGKSMLRLTLERVTRMVSASHCFIITSRRLKEATRHEVQGIIPEANILLEPEKKNTAACIIHATLVLKDRFSSGVVCFIPSDSHIDGACEDRYRDAILSMFNAAEKGDGLVVMGIRPTHPSSAYGYIQFRAEAAVDEEVFPVESFVEKPDVDTARSFLEQGGYLWNSGTVTADLDVLLACANKYLPDHYRHLASVLCKADQDGNKTGAGLSFGIGSAFDQAYAALAPVSFDYGVLERCENIRVVRANIHWNDIGSLDLLAETFVRDRNNNLTRGLFFGLDSEHNVIYGDEGLITAIGVRGLIIVKSGDALVVCPRERAQEVKDLVDGLSESELKEFL